MPTLQHTLISCISAAWVAAMTLWSLQLLLQTGVSNLRKSAQLHWLSRAGADWPDVMAATTAPVLQTLHSGPVHMGRLDLGRVRAPASAGAAVHSHSDCLHGCSDGDGVERSYQIATPGIRPGTGYANLSSTEQIYMTLP